MGKIISPDDQDAKSGQVVLVTHSPSLAGLEMLSRVNEIVRVDRHKYSHIAQPSGTDREWIEENLATFHLLKSDILFAKKVVLVEGYSDRILLETILNQGLGQGDDIAVVDVGGAKSLKKFRRFLEIFEIPFVILADGDAKGLFDSDEVLEIDMKTIPKAEAGTDKRVCLLETNLEGFLSRLEPDLYMEIEEQYKTKPERAYYFARRFFAGDLSAKNADLLKFLTGWVMKNLGRTNP